MTTKTEEYCANEDNLLKCNKISKEDWGQYLIRFSKMTEKIQQKNTAEYKSKYLKNTEQDGGK